MAKYSLTPKQQDMLRAVVAGIDNCEIPQTWTYYFMPTERQDRTLETLFGGIPLLEELDVQSSDLSLFAELGFLTEVKVTGRGGTYHMKEQAIRNAVESDFEDPSLLSSSAPPTSISIEQGAGSFLNISVNSVNASQTINASVSLSEDTKAKLVSEVESLYGHLDEVQNEYPQETRALEKHLRRLVEDVSEPQPDKQDVTDLLARLKGAGQALASITQIVSCIDRIGDLIGQLSFMQ